MTRFQQVFILRIEKIARDYMPTLEQRVEYLFPHKGRCLIKVALIFASRRDDWLTQEDLINFIGADFADSTIRNAFKELSSQIESIDNHSYIDIEAIKNNKRGRPIKRGKLSEAARRRIFALVTPVKFAPQVYNIGLDKIGRIEVPSISYEKAVDRSCTQRIWLPPEEILAQVEQKIGIKELNH